MIFERFTLNLCLKNNGLYVMLRDLVTKHENVIDVLALIVCLVACDGRESAKACFDFFKIAFLGDFVVLPLAQGNDDSSPLFQPV